MCITEHCFNFLNRQRHKASEPIEAACYTQASNLLLRLQRENNDMKATIDMVRGVASGEIQVADDDTEGMAWIVNFIDGAV